MAALKVTMRAALASRRCNRSAGPFCFSNHMLILDVRCERGLRPTGGLRSARRLYMCSRHLPNTESDGLDDTGILNAGRFKDYDCILARSHILAVPYARELPMVLGEE